MCLINVNVLYLNAYELYEISDRGICSVTCYIVLYSASRHLVTCCLKTKYSRLGWLTSCSTSTPLYNTGAACTKGTLLFAPLLATLEIVTD